jgi:hypothetical protein
VPVKAKHVGLVNFFRASVSLAFGSFSRCASSTITTLASARPCHAVRTRTACPSEGRSYFEWSRTTQGLLSDFSRYTMTPASATNRHPGTLVPSPASLSSRYPSATLQPRSSPTVVRHRRETEFSLSKIRAATSCEHPSVASQHRGRPTFRIRNFGHTINAVGQCFALIPSGVLRTRVFRRL